jgi:hypothetical protein
MLQQPAPPTVSAPLKRDVDNITAKSTSKNDVLVTAKRIMSVFRIPEVDDISDKPTHYHPV